MGSVYEVEHVELGKRFVLKALLRELASRPDVVARLRNEWRALGRLQHPNIVAVTDAGTTADSTPYYVMERLEGETLSRVLRRERRLPWERAVRIAADVLAAVGAAHDIGIVHRDVKPPNIFVTGDAEVKLLDFGIAKMAQGAELLTTNGLALGTPRYMSPEQARGEPVDGRADLYSVGLVLYEMLAGRGPFDPARHANDLLLGHLARSPAPLSELVPELPAELDRVVAWLLAKQPDRRPGGAEEAQAALLALLPPRTQSAAAAPGGDAEDDSEPPTRLFRTTPIAARGGAFAPVPQAATSLAVPVSEPAALVTEPLRWSPPLSLRGETTGCGVVLTTDSAAARGWASGERRTLRLVSTEVPATRTSVPVACAVASLSSAAARGRWGNRKRDAGWAALALSTIVLLGVTLFGISVQLATDGAAELREGRLAARITRLPAADHRQRARFPRRTAPAASLGASPPAMSPPAMSPSAMSPPAMSVSSAQRGERAALAAPATRSAAVPARSVHRSLAGAAQSRPRTTAARGIAPRASLPGSGL